jgi:hypothetical protein
LCTLSTAGNSTNGLSQTTKFTSKISSTHDLDTLKQQKTSAWRSFSALIRLNSSFVSRPEVLQLQDDGLEGGFGHFGFPIGGLGMMAGKIIP